MWETHAYLRMLYKCSIVQSKMFQKVEGCLLMFVTGVSGISCVMFLNVGLTKEGV